MSLVPISSLKDILTGSVWDKFKELIEPYALVNGIIFIFLNLVMVYPNAGVSDATSVIGLLTNATTTDEGNLDIWSLVAGTIIVFVLSFLINHLSAFFLDLVSGEVYRNSPIIGKWLLNQQKNIFQKLQDELKNEESADDELRTRSEKAKFRLAYEFPVRNEDLGLTKLGNLLLNPPSYVAYQYGLSMQLVWPIIQEQLKEDNKTLKSIQGNWISLLFFVSLFGILAFVAIELVFVFLFGGGFPGWQILTLLGFAVICSYATLEKARQWGRGMRHIFDAHVKEVFTDLGMDGLKDLTPADDDYKKRWQEVLGWLAYGANWEVRYHPDQAWYQIKAEPTPDAWPKLKHPDFLKVESMPRFVSRELFAERSGKTYVGFEKTVEYLFAITNASAGDNQLSGQDAYLLVQDSDVTPPQVVNGNISKPKIKGGATVFEESTVVGRRREGKPAGLLLPLGDIPPGHSRVLTYSIDSVLAQVSLDVDITKVELSQANNGYFIHVFPVKAVKNRTITAKVELLTDDTQAKLNDRAIIFPIKGEPVKGEVVEDKRIGTWKFMSISNEAEKIRFKIVQEQAGD